MNQKYSSNKYLNILSLYFLIVSVILITIFIFGCGPSINFINTGTSIAAKSNNSPIEVFNSKIPERKYKELGILESEGEYGYASFEEVLPRLKEEACEKGGDAIIIKTIQKYLGNSNDEKIYVTATVIKWLD